ncbi:MAG: RNase P modulator RnpM [Erysipelotrichaceae bacterium]
MKKIPMRKCVATNEQCPKKDLLRIVKTPENTVEIDLTGRKNGRGAYLKKSMEALEVAIKRKSLARALEVEIPQSLYDELKELFQHEQ